MKISYSGLTLPEGKVKYDDPLFISLVEKFQPAKVSPHYFEFLPDDFEAGDVIAIAADSILDLLILDIEKIEGRLSRTDESDETKVLSKCMKHLEAEKQLCDLELDDAESAIVRELSLLSFKPTIVMQETSPNPNDVCRDGMEKAGMMFFYTVGKQEVHAWLVEKGIDAVSCAGKIHSDLARGFIKAEIVSYDDMMTAHNLQDARSKDLTQLVDRDFIVAEKSILDIRFNV